MSRGYVTCLGTAQHPPQCCQHYLPGKLSFSGDSITFGDGMASNDHDPFLWLHFCKAFSIFMVVAVVDPFESSFTPKPRLHHLPMWVRLYNQYNSLTLSPSPYILIYIFSGGYFHVTKLRQWLVVVFSKLRRDLYRGSLPILLSFSSILRLKG